MCMGALSTCGEVNETKLIAHCASCYRLLLAWLRLGQIVRALVQLEPHTIHRCTRVEREVAWVRHGEAVVSCTRMDKVTWRITRRPAFVVPESDETITQATVNTHGELDHAIRRHC